MFIKTIYRSGQSIFSSVDDIRQSAVERLVEVVSRTPWRSPVTVPLFETVHYRVLVRQLELVGEQFSAFGQPRCVADSIQTDTAQPLAVARPVLVQAVPVLRSDDRLRRVGVGDI